MVAAFIVVVEHEDGPVIPVLYSDRLNVESLEAICDELESESDGPRDAIYEMPDDTGVIKWQRLQIQLARVEAAANGQVWSGDKQDGNLHFGVRCYRLAKRMENAILGRQSSNEESASLYPTWGPTFVVSLDGPPGEYRDMVPLLRTEHLDCVEIRTIVRMLTLSSPSMRCESPDVSVYEESQIHVIEYRSENDVLPHDIHDLEVMYARIEAAAAGNPWSPEDLEEFEDDIRDYRYAKKMESVLLGKRHAFTQAFGAAFTISGVCFFSGPDASTTAELGVYLRDLAKKRGVIVEEWQLYELSASTLARFGDDIRETIEIVNSLWADGKMRDFSSPPIHVEWHLIARDAFSRIARLEPLASGGRLDPAVARDAYAEVTDRTVFFTIGDSREHMGCFRVELEGEDLTRFTSALTDLAHQDGRALSSFRATELDDTRRRDLHEQAVATARLCSQGDTRNCTEAKWFRSCRDVLFSLPGMRAIPQEEETIPKLPRPASENRSESQETEFWHSSDFRTIEINGDRLLITDSAAKVVRALHESPVPLCDQKLLDSAGSTGTELRSLFRRRSEKVIWDKLIGSPATGMRELKRRGVPID